jgi:molecular chaperone GrpE (heat shock protein)
MEIDADTSPPNLSAVQRDRMARDFAAWLDRALEEEPLPAGLPAELLQALRDGEPLPPLTGAHSAGEGSDLYSLWETMTTLAQEIRLQGRLFKQLNETLIEKTEKEESASEPGRVAETQSGDRPQAQELRKQQIDLLIDLRDRMQRGIETVQEAAEELAPERLSRPARWLGVARDYARKVQEILAALSHGYSLSLDRLDEALVACGVDRIACLNHIFDPQAMTAIDIEQTSEVPEGTVVEVYRDGYEWNGKIYRTAQVKVARNRGG